MSQNYTQILFEMIGAPSSEDLFPSGSVEGFLGRRLPEDFISLMSAYGSVVSVDEDETLSINVFGLSEMGVEDFINSRNQPIVYMAERVSKFLLEGESGEIDPSLVLSRDPYNLFSVGEIAERPLSLFYDQEFCGWTVIVANGGYWWQFKGGICELLVRISSRDIDIPYLEDFVSQGVSFSRGDI